MTYVDPIYQGQDIQVRSTFLSPDGVAANPSSVRFLVKDPQGTQSTYESGDPEVSTITAGEVFACRFDLAYQGKYRVRAEALDVSSNVIGVDQFSFWVNATNQ